MGTKIYAHRGASKYAPENTLSAFKLAVEMGADGIETDVQLTKDQVPVIIHDESVNRTTNSKGLLRNYTYDELQKLDAGTWFSKNFANSRILSLRDFLAWLKDKPLLLNLELKTNKFRYPGIEKIVLRELSEQQMIERTIISSFHADSIYQMKTLEPRIATGFLSSRKPRNLPAFLKDIGADAFHAKYRLLSAKLINECRQHSIPLRVYTINQPYYIMRALEAWCDVIMTDVPDKALQLRSTFQNRP